MRYVSTIVAAAVFLGGLTYLGHKVDASTELGDMVMFALLGFVWIWLIGGFVLPIALVADMDSDK